ncbi:Retrovirus-related Pol polyprotein from transposon gypsy [Dictyocoela roeselum]|nr:Retrovirus-related Pol polyprotein from transposon gypsy [Dictyocoela roeselum]
MDFEISETSKIPIRPGPSVYIEKVATFLREKRIIHVKTSPYNSTPNGISERINATIKTVLRLYRGHPISEVIKKAETNLNFTYHTVLRASHMEILNGNSIFDFKGEPLKKEEIIEIKKKEQDYKQKVLTEKNKKRIKLKFKVGDKILRKNFTQDKILSRYLGPFKVIRTYDNRGNVWIDEGRRIVRHNVKNLKSFKEGVNVVLWIALMDFPLNSPLEIF